MPSQRLRFIQGLITMAASLAGITFKPYPLGQLPGFCVAVTGKRMHYGFLP